MRTILVRFYHPSQVMDINPDTTDEEIKTLCFRVNKYQTEFECLQAYANTIVIWSTILDENDDWKKFVDDALEHIKNNDYNWLEEHFV